LKRLFCPFPGKSGSLRLKIQDLPPAASRAICRNFRGKIGKKSADVAKNNTGWSLKVTLFNPA
jgi:hypothetical protein